MSITAYEQALLLEMHCFIVLIEHENAIAQRETLHGDGWLSDHTAVVNELKAAYDAAKEKLQQL